MELLKYFFIAFFLSALGTVPIGLITLTIVQKTIEKGRLAGVLVSFGAAAPEFGYTFVALYFLTFLSNNDSIATFIKIVSVLVFLILGVYYMLKKNTGISVQVDRSSKKDIGIGFMAGAMNMLIVPFWLLVGAWMKTNGFYFDKIESMFIFSLGAAMGALLVFYVYILLSEWIVNKVDNVGFYANKIIGIIFICLAVFQALKI